jgi:hypothetical protein
MMRAVVLKSMLAFALVTLGHSFTHLACAADVQIYKISKGIDYQQLPERAPTNLAANAFVFETTVLMSEPGSVSGARVKPPGRPYRTLAPNGDRELRIINRASRKSVLEDRFPKGNYTFAIDTRNDGQRSLRLPLTNNNAFPPAPFVDDLVELQAVNPNGHLVVNWERFANGTAFDFIRLRIEDGSGALAWESRGPGEHGALDGTARWAIIEPGALRPGTAYNATLFFEKFVTRDTNSYPGAVGIASYYKRTRFTITTTSDGPADVERYELSKGRRFEQRGTNAPDPEPDDFIFRAEVRGSNLVVAATLTNTLGSAVPLLPDVLREVFEFSQTASQSEAIEAAFPPGNFVFGLQTVTDGNRRVGLWFDSDNYPQDPTIDTALTTLTNDVAQDAAFVVSWVPWASGTRDDFIQVRVEDEAGNPVFQTPDFLDPNALDGHATSVTIPAGRLLVAHDHRAFLTFRRFNRLNWFDYPGALGVSSIFATTEFEIQTIRPDLEEYSIARGRGFEQEGDATPVPDPNDEFIFDARVEGSSSNAISSVTLITPRGTNISMVPNPPDEFEFSDTATNEAAFNLLYPAGSYTFNIQGRQGALSVVLNVPDSPYPPAPRAHVSALEKPGPDEAVTLTWDPWIGGTSNDFIRVRIQDDDGDTVFESPGRGDVGALTGLDTSVTIPEGTFQLGEDYEGRVRFERFVVENEVPFPGAEGTASYFSRTDFDIEADRPDVEDYRIERGRRFDQTTTDPPLPDTGDEFEFNALVQGSAEHLISSVTLSTPHGATEVLDPNNDFDEFEFTDDAPTLAEYDIIYPPGTYIFTVRSINDGTNDIPLVVPPNDFPPAPHLLSDPRTPVPANRPIVFQWRPWEGGTSDDFIRLRIQDVDANTNVFESPARGDDDHLNGLATSVTIPAGTLIPGREYEGQLVFERIALSDRITLPGAEGRVTYFGRTDFNIVPTTAEVEDYRIERGARFEQTTAGLPVPDLNDEFEFNAEVQGTAPRLISAATFTTPLGGTPIALEPNNDFDEFEFSDQVSTQAEFDTVYPIGTYTFMVEGKNLGPQTFPLDVPATNFPPAPHVLFDPGTMVPANQPLLLQWDAWAGGTTNDFIQLRIEDADGEVVFETPDRGDDGALNGLSTSTNFPAATLVPGQTYEGRLVFERIVHTDETTGAEGRVTYFARTDFNIETVPGDVEDYRIERGRRFEQRTDVLLVPDPGDEFEFNAEVQGSAPNFISSAILTTPPGTNIVLEPNNDFDEFEFSDQVSSPVEFNSLYPGGTYTFTVQGVNQGPQTILLNNVLASAFPPAPHVVFDPRTEVPADQDLFLRWDSWFDSRADDFIQLRIEDANNNVIFETPDRGEVGALDGSAIFVTIPAGTLASAQRYEGRLVFERIALRDETTVPGAEGRVIDFARTDFDIETTGGDVEDYRIERGRRFEQTTAGLPVPDPGDEFEFNAEVQGSEISSANLRTPPSSVIVLDPNNDFDEFEFSDQVSTQAEFDTLYPAGEYNFIVQSANQGTQTIRLGVPASEFPPAPHVQFDPGTGISANSELILFWDAWVGGTNDDFIQLRIEDADNNVVFETPDRGDAGALDGLATATIIPAGTLAAGQTYEGRLIFEHIVLTDETTVPGAEGRVTYFARTDFDIEILPLDVQEYEVFKEHVYVQTSNGPPAATEFVFRALVEAASDISVIGATIITPTSLQVPLTQGGGGDEFERQDSHASQEILDENYPDGEYTLVITGANDGTRYIPVSIANAMYPSAPQLSDYDAAQSLNASAPFVLTWNPFLDGTPQDHIDVQIEDSAGNEVFDTPGHGNDGALDGLATSVVIPPFTLQPGQAYEARILFQKILRADDTGYPGVVGRVGYSARTFAGIATAPVANPLPRIQNFQVVGDGSLQFNVITPNGATYQIQGSPNMIDWTTLGTLSATSGLSTFTVPPPPSVGCYFYRAALIQ